jgi:exocyst complex component 8
MTLQRAADDLGDIPPIPDWMSDLAQQAGMSDGEKQKAERDARWIGDFADELTAAIALREWDKAVDLVGQGAVLFLIACHYSFFF